MSQKFPTPLNHYKKIADNEKSAVLQHPLGHKITIAKNVLSPELRKQLGNLKLHMAGVGEPEDQVVPETDEQLAEEARGLPRKANLSEEAQRSSAGYPKNFPEINQMAKADEIPEVSGPPQPSPEDIYNKKVSTNLDYLKGVNIPYKMGFVNDEGLKQRAEEETLQQMASSKKEEEQTTASKLDQIKDHYDHDVAYIKSQNDLRQKIGLSPLPLPLPPVHIQNAVASADNETPTIKKAVIEAPETQTYQPPPVQQAPGGMPQIQPNDPYGIKTQTAAQMQGFGGVRTGMQGEAEAQKQMSEAQQPLLEQNVQQVQDLQKTYQDNLNKMMQEHSAFTQDLQNQHIDPNHALNSMGAGSKFLTLAGVFLGGLGSGFTGTGNQALELMKNQIDKDVEAQRLELGKKENLLSANMQMFPHMAQAMEMTKANIAEALKAQIAATANKYQNPLIQARAQQAMGYLDAEKIAPALRMGAMMGSMTSGQGSQQTDPTKQLMMLEMSGVISKDQSAAARKELANAQERIAARDHAMDVFNQLNKINTVGNRIGPPIQTPKEVGALIENAATMLAREEAGRVNEYEYAGAKKAFPAPGDNAQTVKIKLPNLLGIINPKIISTTLSGMGIDPEKFYGKYDKFGKAKYH